MLSIDVSKTYGNGNQNKKHRTRKQWKHYFYDENGAFHTKRISFFEAIKWKLRKKARITTCHSCKTKFVSYDRKCPDCE